jgi:hypothetical protein
MRLLPRLDGGVHGSFTIKVEEYVTGFTADVSPLTKEFALVIEDLDSAVLPIANPHSILSVHPNRVRLSELAWGSTGLAPGKEQSALRTELMHSCVTVTIAYIDLT